MNKLWTVFFMIWPILAIGAFVVSPQLNWWFPSEAFTPLGVQIDNLFYLILAIVTLVFIGTQVALGYVLWKGSTHNAPKAWFSHGSHNLEVIWSIAPAGILMFISLYQLDVWMRYRVQSRYPKEVTAVAEVTARQFEWRIRYAAPGKKLQALPQPDDLYTVNDLRVPVSRPVLIRLRSMDVQHSFFVPGLRVKQDAVPGAIIPIWFEVSKTGDYDLTCAELCGWGHYKMRGRVLATKETEFTSYLEALQREQNYDGKSESPSNSAMVVPANYRTPGLD